MIHRPFQPVIIMLAIMLLALQMLVACNGGGDDKEPTVPTDTPSAQPTVEPPGKVTITIGNHTDKSGVAANAMQYIDMALKDVVEYYNEKNLIPGVEVKVVEYDGQADPSKDIPGYEWLKQKGADLIVVWFPWTLTTLRFNVEEDSIPMFGTIVRTEVLYPPGYLFITGALVEGTAWTMVKWVAENGWDYQAKGPAKIGGACWDTDDGDIYFDAFKRYAELHPEQIEWVSGHIAPTGTYTWSPEVQALKDCDYVWVPSQMGNFVREYRQAGYTAKFLGSSPHLAFWGLMVDMKLWDEVDGSLFFVETEWWDEEGEVPDFINQLLREKHPDSYERIIRAGKSYSAAINVVLIMEIIKSATEAVGPQNLDSQAIYEAAQSFTLTFDGLQRHSYSETKRASLDRIAVYEVRGSEENIVRISDWIPIETPP